MLSRTVRRVASLSLRQVRSATAIQCVRMFSDMIEVAPAPENLRTIRHELCRVLDEDASELGATPDSGLTEFIKEQEMKIVSDKDGEVKVTRVVGDYEISTTFSSEADESIDGEETDQDKNKENYDEEDYLPPHAFDVDVKNVANNSTIRIACRASKEGELILDAIIIDPQVIESDEMFVADANRLDVSDLSEAGQEKILELMESLQIDDRLAQFVQHYSQIVRTQQYLEKLRKFKAFLQN